MRIEFTEKADVAVGGYYPCWLVSVCMCLFPVLGKRKKQAICIVFAL